MKVEIGQEVAIQSGGSIGRLMVGYVITKITPSGQITATKGEHKVRFNSSGFELGGGWYRSMLLTDLDEIARRFTAQEAFALVKATGVPMDYRESVQTMSEKLDALETKIAKAREALANLKSMEEKHG